MLKNEESPPKADLRSMDIAHDNRKKLKGLFPGVFTETRNDKGELVESIDFEKLKAELGAISDVFESRRERYGMDWPGKKELPDLDLGFKVLKLNRSSFRIWDGGGAGASEEEMARQLELHIDHIDPGASQEDILFELLLKAGFMPTEKVEKREMAGRVVFAVAGGSLLICLEKEITRELIEAVAEAGPRQFICLDRGFRGNDQLKANAVQTFSARNQGRDKTEQVLFRTV